MAVTLGRRKKRSRRRSGGFLDVVSNIVEEEVYWVTILIRSELFLFRNIVRSRLACSSISQNTQRHQTKTPNR